MVEDAYHLTVDDLNSSAKITRVQARKIHALLQHHLVHQEYPNVIPASAPYLPNQNSMPVKAKYAKDLPKFSGKLEDWIRWKEEAIAVMDHND